VPDAGQHVGEWAQARADSPRGITSYAANRVADMVTVLHRSSEVAPPRIPCSSLTDRELPLFRQTHGIPVHKQMNGISKYKDTRGTAEP